MANSVDPEQTPRSAASDLGLHCLLRLVCRNSKGKNCIEFGVGAPNTDMKRRLSLTRLAFISYVL